MREFWRVEVEVEDKKYTSETQTYYVFATSAAIAESKALKMVEKEYPASKKARCTSAVFVGFIVD